MATRVGSDFQISWITTGDVNKVRIEEGTSPEQIGNLAGEVSGIAVMTVTSLFIESCLPLHLLNC